MFLGVLRRLVRQKVTYRMVLVGKDSRVLVGLVMNAMGCLCVSAQILLELIWLLPWKTAADAPSPGKHVNEWRSLHRALPAI